MFTNIRRTTIDPDSRFYRSWEITAVISVLALSIFYPYMACFGIYLESGMVSHICTRTFNDSIKNMNN